MTPELITAILMPTSVMVLGYFTYLTQRKVKEVHEVVKAVDHAVNGKSPGESSISQDVTTIKEKQESDNPSTEPEPNGHRALVPMVEKLTTLVNNLLAEKTGGT